MDAHTKTILAIAVLIVAVIAIPALLVNAMSRG